MRLPASDVPCTSAGILCPRLRISPRQVKLDVLLREELPGAASWPVPSVICGGQVCQQLQAGGQGKDGKRGVTLKAEQCS